MKYPITLLLFLVCYWSIGARVQGIVTAKGEPVEFVYVVIVGQSTGTMTDNAGRFVIPNIKKGKHILVVSGIGYERDSVTFLIRHEDDIRTFNFSLKETQNTLEDVTIKASQMQHIVFSPSPVPIEIITSELFRKNPTPSIFEALNMVNGVRPQLQCNVCNAGDIHINGMEGPYTMILIDGMPIVSALGTVYGLMGIPNSLLHKVEVQKGPASALYGSEAIAGTINVITKSAENAPAASIDIMGTSYADVNTDVSVKYKLSRRLSVLSSGNYFHFTKRWDVNQDNFTDVTLQKRAAIFNKFSYTHASGQQSHVAFRYYYEDRWGGEMQWNRAYRGGDEIYGESIYTKRFEVMGATHIPVLHQGKLLFSFNTHNQNSAYGNTLFLAKQDIGFIQLTETINRRRQKILLGAALRYTYLDDNTDATRNITSDANAPSETYLPGVFVQNEISVSEKSQLLLGMRYDYHHTHKSIISGRANWKYTLQNAHIFRLGLGNGFRLVNIFTEDHASLSGAREVVIKNDIRPEESWNATLNYSYIQPISTGFISLDAGVFYTYFSNRIVADFFTNSNQIIYDNLHGHGINRGASVQAQLHFMAPFKVLFGATLVDVFLINREEGELVKTRQIQTPPFTSNVVLTYLLPAQKVEIDVTGNTYSPMLLPVLENDFRATYSPWFSLFNIQFTKTLSENLQVYGGVKNVFGFFPKDPILRAHDPFDRKVDDPVDNPKGYTFDPGYNYAPLQDRRVFIGVRWTLH